MLNQYKIYREGSRSRERRSVMVKLGMLQRAPDKQGMLCFYYCVRNVD